MTDTKEVAISPLVETSVEVLLAKAIEKNVPVESLEKLLTMRRELRAEWAKGEYDKAMSEFQSECPIIKKSKKGGETKSGYVAYYYAPLDVIVEQTRDIITKHGFSYAIQTKTEAAKVKVTCIVRHFSGHSEATEYEVPIAAGTNIMSASQVVASTLTFAKRYAFCNAFGIMTGDDDNDAAKENPEEVLKKSVEEAIKRLRGAANLNAVKHVWASLSGELREHADIRKVVEELKTKYPTHENPNIPVAGGVATS